MNAKHQPVTAECPIKPEHIDASRHFFNAFDHNQTECSAHYIVTLCQERGGWLPFTSEEIEAHYRKAGHKDGFTFNRLVDPEAVFAEPAHEFERMMMAGKHARTPMAASLAYMLDTASRPPKMVNKGGHWIIVHDGKFWPTLDFVMRCFQSSPKVTTSTKQTPRAR